MASRKRIGQALMGFGAGFRGQGAEFIQQIDDKRKQALMDDAFRLQSLLTPGPGQDVPGAQDLLLNRFDDLRKLKASDTSDTLGLLRKIDDGNIEGALSDVSTVVDYGYARGWLVRPAGGAQFSSTKKVVGFTASGKEFNGSVTQRMNPTDGSIEAVFQPDVGEVDPNDPIVRTENVGTLGITGQEQIDERQKDRIELAREQTTQLKLRKVAEIKVTREQTFINEAISVGEELPEIKRAIELLKFVKTGGFQAARIRAKQFFGIESADEGELASKLSVAVLARLRKTFGAQFTEGEGARLDRASARLGANAATNQRILETTLKRMEREVRRGLRFAESYEDTDAADLINDALTFTYGSDPVLPGPLPAVSDPRALPGFDELSPEDQDELLQRAQAGGQ